MKVCFFWAHCLLVALNECQWRNIVDHQDLDLEAVRTKNLSRSLLTQKEGCGQLAVQVRDNLEGCRVEVVKTKDADYLHGINVSKEYSSARSIEGFGGEQSFSTCIWKEVASMITRFTNTTNGTQDMIKHFTTIETLLNSTCLQETGDIEFILQQWKLERFQIVMVCNNQTFVDTPQPSMITADISKQLSQCNCSDLELVESCLDNTVAGCKDDSIPDMMLKVMCQLGPYGDRHTPPRVMFEVICQLHPRDDSPTLPRKGSMLASMAIIAVLMVVFLLIKGVAKAGVAMTKGRYGCSPYSRLLSKSEDGQ